MVTRTSLATSNPLFSSLLQIWFWTMLSSNTWSDQLQASFEQKLQQLSSKKQKSEDNDWVGEQGWNLAIQGSSGDRLVANKTKPHWFDVRRWPGTMSSQKETQIFMQQRRNAVPIGRDSSNARSNTRESKQLPWRRHRFEVVPSLQAFHSNCH